VKQHVAIERFADRAAAYGIPGTTVDGNDVLAVYRATKEAADRARNGEGPSLIEVKTFRMRGHAEHDDAFYVPKELVTEWEGRDPILRLTTYMEENHLIAPSERAALDQRIAQEVEAALEWAEQSPLPEPGAQAEGVYASTMR
jgi:pyruvate dehydrogenase E1 component alpha subunit